MPIDYISVRMSSIPMQASQPQLHLLIQHTCSQFTSIMPQEPKKNPSSQKSTSQKIDNLIAALDQHLSLDDFKVSETEFQRTVKLENDTQKKKDIKAWLQRILREAGVKEA